MATSGRVEKIVEGGWGLIRSRGPVVLLRNVIPGEKIRYAIREEKKGIAWGEVMEIIEASPDRIPPPCPYYGECGGCMFQHIRYSRQLTLKREVFLETLQRIGRMDICPEKIISSPPTGYRIRAKFKSAPDGRIGYIEKGTHRVLPIDQCLIVTPAISRFLTLYNRLASPPFSYQFDVLENAGQLSVYLPHPPTGADRRTLEDLAGEKVRFYWKSNWKESLSPLSIGGFEYQVSPAVFFQVNRHLWTSLLETVDRHLFPMEEALDLYSGVGFFVPLLQTRARRVSAVENHPLAIQVIQKQFPRCRLYPQNAEKFSFPPADLLLVDPPRCGLSSKVLGKILSRRYPRIIYISCYPASLARDCRILLDRGKYRIVTITLLDLFPQTPHLESITLLERPGR